MRWLPVVYGSIRPTSNRLFAGPRECRPNTGRYLHSHGSSYNFVPLKVGEMTIGGHLRPLWVKSVLIGKTHMRADGAGMAKLGIDREGMIDAH